MDMFDFEELVSDMLDITDDQREDDSFLELKFYEEFGIELEQGLKLAERLLPHTPIVRGGLVKKPYHAFVSKSRQFMIMKIEATS